jgi:anti-sigma factor RsiW
VSTSAHRRDPHLGGLAAAVVDGALDHEARERALGHLARCDDCRAEVEAQRRIKARLARLTAPEVPGGLAERLLALPDGVASGTTQIAGVPPVRLAASFRPAPGGPRDRSRPMGVRPPGPRIRRATRRRAVGATAGGIAGGIAVFALSLATVLALGTPERTQTVVPAVDSYTVEHARTAVGVPGADPLVDAVGVATTAVR